MTTKTFNKTSEGQRIKDAINGGNADPQQETLNVIHNFLAENETYTNNTDWHLHCYCRTGKDEDYGYQHGELEYTSDFLQHLIKVFMNPKASKIYCQVSDMPASTLSNYLIRLKDLFDRLMECEVTEAKLDEIEIGYFNYNKDGKQVHNTKVRICRKAEIAATTEKVISKYYKQFI